MPPKRSASPSAPQSPSDTYISESIHDRKSTFIGYYLPDATNPKALQAREEVKSASHRILAWRQPSSQKTLFASSRPIYKVGHDDDGEQWAGKRIEKVMDELDIQGVIMVARWYGGELLGPVRFKHIEDVAKGAVEAWRADNGGDTAKRQRLEEQPTQISPAPSGSNETMRPEELQRRRQDLVDTLRRRDNSILTLRALLEEKKNIANQGSSQSAANLSPSRIINYDTMPFNRLQALENARDASIGFLLKQIDKVEAEHAERIKLAREKAQADEELKAEREEFELDEAWEDMQEAMKEVDEAKAEAAKRAAEKASKED